MHLMSAVYIQMHHGTNVPRWFPSLAQRLLLAVLVNLSSDILRDAAFKVRHSTVNWQLHILLLLDMLRLSAACTVPVPHEIFCVSLGTGMASISCKTKVQEGI